MRKVIVKVAVALLVLSQECYIIHHIKCDNNNQEITRATKEVIKEITSIEQDSSSLFTKDGLELNKTDLAILYKLASAEAGRNNIVPMQNVVRVVLNRVENPNFKLDNTVEQTVFRDRQFSCVRDGNFGKAIVNDAVVKAVNEAVTDYSFTNNKGFDATHFANLSICDPSWQHDMTYLFTDEAGHSFFK